MKWKEISVGHQFKDNSILTEKHQEHLENCVEIEYLVEGNKKTIVVSEDHLIKVNISYLYKSAKEEVEFFGNQGKIKTKEDVVIKSSADLTPEEYRFIYKWVVGEIREADAKELPSEEEEYLFNLNGKEILIGVDRLTLEEEHQKIDDNNYWVPAAGLVYLFEKYGKYRISENVEIISVKPAGQRPAFCISTDTKEYELNGLVHHNSVAVQNLIQHAIEHRNKISTLLLDPKFVEFENYKDMKGVVAVANTPKEIVEVMRIARLVMYKRNAEMSKMGIKNIHEYVPKDYSGKIYVTGVDMPEDEVVRVKIDSEEKTITVKELEELVREREGTVDICLNGKDWIPVNKYSVEKIYNDEMPFLFIVCDELAELSTKEGGKSEAAKENDAYRDEILSILSSIAQLGRSAGLCLIIATQRPLASVIPTILRGNLGNRLFCGKAPEAGMSMVTLDNTLATTVDNTHPGAGIFQAGGASDAKFLRFYFSKFSDLEDYYSVRGLDSKGYSKYDTVGEDLTNIPDSLSGEIVIEKQHNQVKVEIDDESVILDRRKDQEWTEV